MRLLGIRVIASEFEGVTHYEHREHIVTHEEVSFRRKGHHCLLFIRSSNFLGEILLQKDLTAVLVV